MKIPASVNPPSDNEPGNTHEVPMSIPHPTITPTTGPISTKDNPLPPLGTPINPASSCKDIPPEYPSGNYTLKTVQSGTPFTAYCDMTPGRCNTTGGWTRVAHLNMSNPDQSCPSGLANITHNTSMRLRLCHNPSVGTCVSTIYSTHGIKYSQITGKVVGYQYGATKAFYGYQNSFKAHTIEGVYVDGVSITIGRPGYRHHVWTFASAYNEEPTNFSYSCSCISDQPTRYRDPPSFVSADYFCDTGAVKDSFDHTLVDETRLYTEHPLWDGKGCGDGSSCCEFNRPPWFCQHLPETITDDIEVRLCAYSASPYISEIELLIK